MLDWQIEGVYSSDSVDQKQGDESKIWVPYQGHKGTCFCIQLK